MIKKRLLPVEIDGPALAPGTPVLAEGKEAGIMRSATGASAWPCCGWNICTMTAPV